MADWYVSVNDAVYNTEEPPVFQYYRVVAHNNKTGKTFDGTRADFLALSTGSPLDSGNLTKTGAGQIFTSQNVSHCSKHRVINTHVSAAVTVDVSFDNGSTWATGVEVLLQDGTYATSIAAGKYAWLDGVFDKVRLTCSATSAGRLTSYTLAQL